MRAQLALHPEGGIAEPAPPSTSPTRGEWGHSTTVARFHASGLEAGGRDNDRPSVLPDYSLTYYAAFLLDPDGNNVEVVCPC